jgi:hypothetical protein
LARGDWTQATRPTDGKIKGAAPRAFEAIAAQSLSGRRSVGHGTVDRQKPRQINASNDTVMSYGHP